MPDHPIAPRVGIANSRVFAGDAISRVFISETVSQVLVGDASLEGTLSRLALLANGAISGSEMVAVTTQVAGRPRTAGSTAGLASEVDDLQHQSGEGPCLDAVRDQRLIRVDHMERDRRWRMFGRAAAAKGIHSSLTLPLVVHHQGVGTLSCYSLSAVAFSVDDERTASAFAIAAAIVLAYWDAHHQDQHLGLAPGSLPRSNEARAS